MSQHAFLAPSFAPTWGHCSLAPQLSAANPQPETQDDREGTASHWYAEQLLKRLTPAAVAPNGVILTDEMRDAAMVYVRNVQATIARFAPCELYGGPEVHVACHRISPYCDGTPDYFLYVPYWSLLIVWNYKYGHKEVSEFENRQEVSYVSGLLDHLRIDGAAEQKLKVEIRIVQPRCYSARGIVRTWPVMATELRGLWNQLQAKAAEALTPNPPATTGSHCFYCPGRHACEAARQVAMTAIEYSGQSVPELLTPEIVSFELNLLERAAEAIETRYTGLVEQAKSMIVRDHKIVPGYALEGTRGRLTWKIPPAILRDLARQHNVQLEKPDQFITPTQAVAAGIDEAVIKAHAERPNTGLKLIKQDATAIRRILSQAE